MNRIYYKKMVYKENKPFNSLILLSYIALFLYRYILFYFISTCLVRYANFRVPVAHCLASHAIRPMPLAGMPTDEV